MSNYFINHNFSNKKINKLSLRQYDKISIYNFLLKYVSSSEKKETTLHKLCNTAMTLARHVPSSDKRLKSNKKIVTECLITFYRELLPKTQQEKENTLKGKEHTNTAKFFQSSGGRGEERDVTELLS